MKRVARRSRKGEEEGRGILLKKGVMFWFWFFSSQKSLHAARIDELAHSKPASIKPDELEVSG